jgi:hypothetical protein
MPIDKKHVAIVFELRNKIKIRCYKDGLRDFDELFTKAQIEDVRISTIKECADLCKRVATEYKDSIITSNVASYFRIKILELLTQENKVE